MTHSKEKVNRNYPQKTPVGRYFKDFKTTVLKMLKELKEDVEKVKKMKYEQSGNCYKDTENLKRHSQAEKYNNRKVKIH